MTGYLQQPRRDGKDLPNLKASLDRLLTAMKSSRGPEPTYRCKCRDTGMCEVGEKALRPCERCNERAFKLWKAGCMVQEHRGCEKCRPSARRTDRSEVYS